jgi:hypothetical protein
MIIFDEMQNGAICTILMTDRQEYLKILKNLPFVSWQIRTLPLLCISSLQNLGKYASIPEKIACHSS